MALNQQNDRLVENEDMIIVEANANGLLICSRLFEALVINYF